MAPRLVAQNRNANVDPEGAGDGLCCSVGAPTILLPKCLAGVIPREGEAGERGTDFTTWDDSLEGEEEARDDVKVVEMSLVTSVSQSVSCLKRPDSFFEYRPFSFLPVAGEGGGTMAEGAGNLLKRREDGRWMGRRQSQTVASRSLVCGNAAIA